MIRARHPDRKPGDPRLVGVGAGGFKVGATGHAASPAPRDSESKRSGCPGPRAHIGTWSIQTGALALVSRSWPSWAIVLLRIWH